MRIAITADPELPVPPKLYGGIERVVDLLARGLAERGHEVTLFAHPESTCPVRLVPFRGRSSRSQRDTIANMAAIALRTLGDRFDVIHSFGRLAYLLPLMPLRVPKLMTYQREITRASIVNAQRLSRGTLEFSAISRAMMKGADDVGRWHLVYNGVDSKAYRFVPQVAPDAPLVFLGRIEHIKGTHLAIDIARRSGRKLVIAGNIPDAHRDYFERQVRPHIDGDRVSYVGPVDDRQKDELLGSACAFLMPILWEEPFGIVMAEALACGTPVLGLARGSVPEVVQDGVTGFVRDDAEALAATVARVASLDRYACRERAERLFSDGAVVDGYLDVYAGMRARIGGGASA
jgi:glycosyltransferase involved in cell wall biosynthesis